MDRLLQKQIEVAATEQECGVCIWDLAENSVIPDRHLSTVFDLPFEVARHGLPIERYIAKVWPEDRPKVAKALHEAIVSGRAYRQTYRVQHSNGNVVSVLAFGQCFPDENGVASQYIGVIFAQPEDSTHSSRDKLLTLCREAEDYARDIRNDTVRSILELAVLQLTQRKTLTPEQGIALKH